MLSIIRAAQVEVPDRKLICPERPRRKVSTSRPSQTESVYVQTLPDGKCLCPDFRAFKFFRAFNVRSKIPMSRLSCVLSCLCPDNRAFKVVYVQTIVRSKLSMYRLSCVQSCLCTDFRAFKVVYVQTFVRSKLSMYRLSCVTNQKSCAQKLILCAFMSKLSCVQNTLCPDFRAFEIALLSCNPNRNSCAPKFIIVLKFYHFFTLPLFPFVDLTSACKIKRQSQISTSRDFSAFRVRRFYENRRTLFDLYIVDVLNFVLGCKLEFQQTL